MAGIGPEGEAQPPTQDPAFPTSATDPKSTTIYKDTVLLSHTLDSARAIRCKSLVHLGEWSQALGACQHAISHTPGNHELLYLSGKCLVELRRPNEAVALFGLAIEAKSDHLPSWLARGLTFHLHLKDPARAVSDFHTSIVLNPTYYKAFFYMGMAMTDLQRHELAVEAYCRSIHLNATYSESYFRRGVIHLQHQRLELAIEDFAKVSELVPYSAEAHYNRALAQHLLKRNEDAIASYNCCLQYQPTYVNALKNCALAQSELGLYNEAFENYSTALEDCKLDDTTKMDILMSRGQVCERNHDLDQALADYTQAIELNPSFGRAHTCRGLLQIQRHDLSSALTDLSTALLLEPENARAWNNRGTAYLQLNQLDLALSDFEHSISLCPGFVKALRNRGKVYYLQQNLPSALQSLTAAIQQPTSSADPECFILRGSVHHSLGLTSRALKDFGRAPEAARKRNWRVEQSDLLEWMSSEH
jgi:tetratricopeptide (TPR) repeat protein